MPRIPPDEFTAMPLEAFALLDGFSLHDVWRVELPGASSCTITELRRRLDRGAKSTPPNLAVRSLFRLRSLLGRLFGLDAKVPNDPSQLLIAGVPEKLRRASDVPTGTPEGPFTTLYVLSHKAAYEIVNSTVHAVLLTALVRVGSGHRFYWATYVKPVGRVTSFYMRLIDPFRHAIVYPGLESWLKRLWAADR